MAYKILVVDDEKLIVKGIKFSLEQDGMDIDVAYDGEEALELIKKNDYDLAVLDVMLPKMDGLQVCREVREFSQMPIIMVTAKGEDMDKILGLEYVADDYMTKPFSLMVLVSKVHAFMRRLGSDGALIRSGEISVNYSEMKAYKNKEPVSLSKKELQLLLFLLENAGQIVSKEQILEKVWDLDGQFVDENTVPVNISRLKSKIGNDYIRNVRGLGYIWTEESLKE